MTLIFYQSIHCTYNTCTFNNKQNTTASFVLLAETNRIAFIGSNSHNSTFGWILQYYRSGQIFSFGIYCFARKDYLQLFEREKKLDIKSVYFCDPQSINIFDQRWKFSYWSPSSSEVGFLDLLCSIQPEVFHLNSGFVLPPLSIQSHSSICIASI